jgi:NADH dehydrogenase [ubiquinone] 1 alpha subcomplex assembly factor 5
MIPSPRWMPTPTHSAPCPGPGGTPQATPMTRHLFDASLLPVRQARAEALGGDYFLHERAFDECLDRIATVRRAFSSAWLLGPERRGWRERLEPFGSKDFAFNGPGDDELPTFAAELCVSIGMLDTAEGLPALLNGLRHMLAPGALFIGAFAGGNSLPTLRSAMAAADRVEGVARPHFHPHIDPASFGGLLADAGFADPVVDVDRVTLSYASLGALVRDLRAMATTNRLVERPRSAILRRGWSAAEGIFAANASDGRTTEVIEIIHFAAWTPTEVPASSRMTQN